MKKYKIQGQYTYKVEKIVEANDEQEALEIASNHSEPLCEWDSIEQDSYREDVERVEEQND